MNKITSILLGMLGTLAVGAFGWVWTVNVEVKLMRAEITQMQMDQHRDQSQDDNIKALWHWVSFLNRQVDELRFKVGLPPAPKPQME